MSGPTFCSATRTQPQLTLAGVNVGAICSTHEEITVGKMMQNSALGEDSFNESNSEGPVDGKGYVKPVFGEPEIVEISARAPQFKKSIQLVWHLTANKHLLRDIRSPGNETIIIAKEAKIKVECAGSIDITTVIGSDLFEIEIKNVPHLATKVVSVSQLTKNGNKVIFVSDYCKIYNRYGQLAPIAEVIDNVYKLKTKQVQQLVLPAVSGKL
ncbi:hypothetical protein HHI36_016646 [Cryptolaemus montrouzieri]|uniref:Retrovirus-related Pol polyprotein from transposon TNT 1-94-like beta-barrel domain-containing protein n=1 Tax=Cryptolaemus montrouzieri TaxID=559131 RepID=A0ABD2NL24_9CUCU